MGTYFLDSHWNGAKLEESNHAEMNLFKKAIFPRELNKARFRCYGRGKGASLIGTETQLSHTVVLCTTIEGWSNASAISSQH